MLSLDFVVISPLKTQTGDGSAESSGLEFAGVYLLFFRPGKQRKDNKTNKDRDPFFLLI